MSVNIAFDVGGTFTDIVVSHDGEIQQQFLKVPTTSANPAIGVLQGLKTLLRERDISPASVTSILHATTVATNAVLERKGSRTALVTTKGFRDVLAIGRQKRHETYSVRLKKPEPIVPRYHVYEIAERVGSDGAVVEPIDDAEIRTLARKLAADQIETVAVCFLHSYANPEHERRVAAILREENAILSISLSSQVSPKIREYERTSTTTTNAFVQKIVASYLHDLEDSLRSLGIEAKLQIMQSNGGLVTTDFAADFPVRIVESGPAAGVLMSAYVGKLENLENVFTFDMGGTTAKVGAVAGGVAAVTATFEVDMVDFKRGSGLPLNIPSVELVEIGAGGGSIAQIDLGVIKVGPQSAGSIPGPACYDRGGKQPTVTDANVVLGYIGDGRFNGRAMRLNTEAARRVVEENIAKPLGLTIEKAAWGIHTLATNNMERALRIVSIERGRDPRNYAMVAFGGAGPLHAARLARQLSIPKLVVPVGAGVGSAVGLLNANPKFDVSVTRIIAAESANLSAIQQVYSELEGSLSEQLRDVGVEESGTFSRFVYMRFRGQGFEVKVDLDCNKVDEAFIESTRQKFLETYRRIYGRVEPRTAPLITDWYLVYEGAAPAHSFGKRQNGKIIPLVHRPVYFPEAGGYVDCPVYDRYGLSMDETVVGPAIIEEDETSLVLLKGDKARVSEHGNIIVEIETVVT